jgi:hypothetical protein
MHRRLIVLLGLAAFAWPATAAGKLGAMFVPQLLTLPSGQATRLHLDVLPLVRGVRVVIPAPRAGSVPVVSLRLLSGRRVLRFTGAPLEGPAPPHSVVWIKLPVSNVSQQWDVSVRAGGHVYPDLIDRPVTSMATPHAPAVIRRMSGASGHPPGPDPAWPFVLGGLTLVAAAGALALGRAGPFGWRTVRR